MDEFLNITLVIDCPADDELDLQADYIQGGIFTFVGLGTIILNLIMASVYKLRGLDKASKGSNRVMYCIVITDIIGGFVGLYMGIYLLAARQCWFKLWYLEDIVCGLWPMLWLACTTATTLLVPLISIIRFTAVILPMKFHIVLKKEYIMPVLALMGTLSVISAFFPLISGFYKTSGLAMCVFDLTSVSYEIHIVYGWFFNFFPTVLSVLIVTFTNSCVLYKLIQQARNSPQRTTTIRNSSATEQAGLSTISDDSYSSGIAGSPSPCPPIKDVIGPASKLQREAPASLRPVFSGQSKTILLLALSYLLCYALRLFLYGLLVSWPQKPYGDLLLPFMSADAAFVFRQVSDNCLVFNSFLNPIIYLAFSRRIRREFLAVVTCRTMSGSST